MWKSGREGQSSCLMALYVCHTEAFDFYVKDSGELLKDFTLGYDMSRNESLKDYLFSYVDRLKM